MGLYIEDGQGSGVTAGVTSTHRLRTTTVSFTALQSQAILGYSYNINTGVIALSSSLESGVCYVKNTSAVNNLHLNGLNLSLGNSVSGSGDVVVRFYQNPTAGTMLSYMQPVTASSNRKFSVLTTVPATMYKGGDGTTATGGTYISTYVFQTGNNHFMQPDFVITPGTSVAFTVQPKSGNTMMLVAATIDLFLANEDVV
jgi:hypothetical protein